MLDVKACRVRFASDDTFVFICEIDTSVKRREKFELLIVVTLE